MAATSVTEIAGTGIRWSVCYRLAELQPNQITKVDVIEIVIEIVIVTELTGTGIRQSGYYRLAELKPNQITSVDILDQPNQIRNCCRRAEFLGPLATQNDNTVAGITLEEDKERTEKNDYCTFALEPH